MLIWELIEFFWLRNHLNVARTEMIFKRFYFKETSDANYMQGSLCFCFTWKGFFFFSFWRSAVVSGFWRATKREKFSIGETKEETKTKISLRRVFPFKIETKYVWNRFWFWWLMDCKINIFNQNAYFHFFLDIIAPNNLERN